MLELTPEETEYLNNTSTCHLATVDRNGQPHVVPVRAMWDGTALIFTTGLGTKKYRNLKAHPRAALSVGDFSRRAGVLLQGEAELIERGDEFVRTQQQLIDRGMMRRMRQEGEEAVVRLTPVKKASWGINQAK